MSGRAKTGCVDRNKIPIYIGDILLNPMMCDLWVVVVGETEAEAHLIPNSGRVYIGDDNFPAHTESLKYVSGIFEVVGCIDEAPGLIQGDSVSYAVLEDFITRKNKERGFNNE